MKIVKILIATAILLTVSCNKDNEVCWICDLTNLPPTTTQHPDYIEACQPTPPTKWEDGLGNTFGGFTCVKK